MKVKRERYKVSSFDLWMTRWECDPFLVYGVVPEITCDMDSTYEKAGVMDNGQADTEAVGMGRVSTRNRTEGIYNGYEPEHSMEPTNDNNTKNTCKVNRKEDREKNEWKNKEHGKGSG